ncbi:MAG TPA: FG-GAP-like repeat-containing protein [Thermoanaerobaculia bacterium]|jgi:hypothetical protein|nr:FG-GAP-like repeat-containing protein [Thermoanaerobaculia bacterium]
MKRPVPLLLAAVLVCAPLAADQALFRNASIGYGGGSVSDMKTADVNHDGNPDVILLQTFGATGVQSLMTLFGNGDGTFRAPVKTAVVSPGSAIAVGDLDGDGNVDVVLNVQFATLDTYHGNSDGSFTLRSSQKQAKIIGGAPLVLTDLNGDGKLDLISDAATVSTNAIVLVTFRGKGDGTFDAGITQPPANTPSSPISLDIAVGDFNGDGFTDVLESSVQLATGRGDGSFNAPTLIPTLDGRAATPIAGDFNGDGKLDYVSLRTHAAVVHLGHGNGTFTDGARYTTGDSFAGTVADLDGDGKLDVVITGNDLVTVMHGNGDGTFAVQSYVTNFAFHSAVADFDGDHHPDVLVAPTPTPTLLFVHGNGDGTLAAYRKDFVAPAPATEFFPTDSPRNLAAGDFNGDGKPDVVTWLNGLIALPNNGKGGFGTPMPLALPAGVDAVSSVFAVGDMNGDGKADIVATSATKLWTYLSSGNGTFTATSAVTIAFLGTLALADMNGDGHLDALLGQPGFPGQLLLGNGDGTFAAPAPLPASPGFIADFNGDGRLDFTSVTSAAFYDVFLNNGDGTFTAKERVSNTNRVRAAGDFNGDGKIDLIEAEDSAYYHVRLGKGDGTFTNLPNFRIGQDVSFVTADFDGDGKLDLAFSNTVILGNGDGTFRAIVPAVASRDWSGPVAADIDGNGSPDLVLLDGQNRAVNTLLTRTASAGTRPFPMAVATSLTLLHPGETVTVTATPTMSSTFVPSGGIRLTVDGTFAGFADWSNGTASLNWIPLSTGEHTFAISFVGDDVFSASTSSISHTALKLDSVLDLSVSPSPWQLQQLTSILYRVSPRQSSITLPTGTITIRDDETVVFSGAYSSNLKGISYRFPTVGTHTMTADYSGDANYTPATATYAHIVTKGIAVGVSLTGDPGSPLAAGQSLTLTFRMGGVANPESGTVTFRDFGADIGTVAVSFFAASITIQPQPGYHSYSATFNGNALIDPAKSRNLDYEVRTIPCAPAANCGRKHATH